MLGGNLFICVRRTARMASHEAVRVRKSLLSARKARRLGAVQEFQKIVLHFRRKSVLMYICFRARNVQSLSSLREAETCSGALDEVLALN